MKVLFLTEQWVNGGVSSFIMNLLRNFNYEDFSVDIVVSENMTDFYDEELSMLNVKKTCLVANKRISPITRIMKTVNSFENILQKEKYDIVHFHLCNAVGLVYAKIAKNYGIERIVVHSHNSMINSRGKVIANNICKYFFQSVPDIRLACSDLAAKFLYPQKYFERGDIQYIHNAINIDRYRFNINQRKEMRKKMGLKDELLLCHIGRYIPQKNHTFLIDVFKALVTRTFGNCKLLLIGEGLLKKEIIKKVEKADLSDKVITIENSREIPAYLSASDVFILPSLFEGLPVVGIEAQANGIPCIFSDTITKQVGLLETTQFVNLGDSSELWAELIYKCKIQLADRIKQWKTLEQKGYDIHNVAIKLQRQIYKS